MTSVTLPDMHMPGPFSYRLGDEFVYNSNKKMYFTDIPKFTLKKGDKIKLKSYGGFYENGDMFYYFINNSTPYKIKENKLKSDFLPLSEWRDEKIGKLLQNS